MPTATVRAVLVDAEGHAVPDAELSLSRAGWALEKEKDPSVREALESAESAARTGLGGKKE